MPQQDVLERETSFCSCDCTDSAAAKCYLTKTGYAAKPNYSDQQEPIIKQGLSSQKYIHTK